MIEPQKYMDLELSLVNISYFLLSKLKKEKALKYDTALDFATMLFGDDVKETFLPALNFLFLLGKIKYNKEKDTIIFIDKE